MNSISNLEDFTALDPFFRIEQGLEGIAGPGHFFDLAVHHDTKTGVVVLEYASEGLTVSTRRPFKNRYISLLTISDGKLTHWRDYLDPIAVFDALGWPTR